MNTIMKICYLGFLNSIHLQRWAKWFSEKSHDVHIISYEKHCPSEIPAFFDELDIKIHIIKVKKNIFYNFLPYKSKYISIPQFRKLINEIKPDIVHGHYLTYYGLPTILSGKYPRILSGWGSDVFLDWKESWLSKWILYYSLHRVDIVTSVSKQMTSELISLGVHSDRILTFPIGVDINRFNINAKPIFKPKKKIVISNRNLKPVYNISLLIKAIPFVISSLRDVKFIICGDGPLKEELIKLTHELNIEKYVCFAGLIDNDLMPSYLTSSDVYVSTSLSDGASISLMEAMACGVFPVVTDIPANREWITHNNNGFLTPIDDPKKLASFIIDALENFELKNKAIEQNQRLICNKAIWNKNMEIVEETYKRLIN